MKGKMGILGVGTFHIIFDLLGGIMYFERWGVWSIVGVLGCGA